MGLAASQARLLTITSRKADCEFQSMTLSHQKLALSRDMESISDAYQSAMNTTKLVYDYQGTGNNKMDLTYGLLMTPSMYNDYYPKMVTDSHNRILLNSEYARAAREAGIPAEGLLGTPSSDVRNKFIRSLVANSVITPGRGAAVEAVTYGNTIGLGSTLSVATSEMNVNNTQLLELIKYNTVGTQTWALANGMEAIGSGILKYTQAFADGTDENNGKATEALFTKDGKQLSDYELNLYDLLTSNTHYFAGADQNGGTRSPIVAGALLQNSLVDFVKWMDEQFCTVLGSTEENSKALIYAQNKVMDLVKPDNRIQDEYDKLISKQNAESDLDKRKEKAQSDDYKQTNTDWIFGPSCSLVGDGAVYDPTGTFILPCWPRNGTSNYKYYYEQQNYSNYIGMTYVANNDKKYDSSLNGLRGMWVKCDLNNLAQVYLTSVMEYLEMQENGETSYNWKKGEIDSNTKLFDINKDKANFTVLGELNVEGESDLYAGFYDAMFNQICMNGWVQNSQIDDKDYLAEMFKTGKAYLSTISSDGYFYQSQASNDPTIIEVADDTAIAQAEAKYNREKTRIESKEETLDMKMKSIETELSSLNQEYETVKSVITKSIEKAFKRYEA